MSVLEVVPLSVAARTTGVSPQTLRRLCASAELPATRVRGIWRVRLTDVYRYLAARPNRGRRKEPVHLRGPAVRSGAEAANPTIRDAYGWRFDVAWGGQRGATDLWVSRNLYVMLVEEGRDPRELVLRAAEPLVAEHLIQEDAPPREIFLRSQDRNRLLQAAGQASFAFRPSDAPRESGVVVLYDHTARDGIWPGDRREMDDGWADIYVRVLAESGRRRVLAVRVDGSRNLTRRRDLLSLALSAYGDRCARLGVSEDDWARHLRNALTVPSPLA